MSPDEPAATSIIFQAIRRVIDAGSVAALVTLIDAPAHLGAKMVVEEDGATTGSFGDVSVDLAVTRQAKSFLESREETRTYKVAEFAPDISGWHDSRVLFERLQPDPHLVICGAGHVGAALARLAAAIHYRTTLIDDRPQFVGKELFADLPINLISTNDWTDAILTAIGDGRGVSVAIVTRAHNEDEQCLRALIGVEVDYIGLIGSKRRTNIVLERMREAGADDKFLQQVRAPIGLDIGAVTPEEVALSILSEVVAQRRGRQGGSLSTWRRKK